MLRDIGRVCMLFAGLLIFTFLVTPSSTAPKAAAEPTERQPVALADMQTEFYRSTGNESEFLFEARVLEVRRIADLGRNSDNESPAFQAILQVTHVAPGKGRLTLKTGQIIEFRVGRRNHAMLSRWMELQKTARFVYSNLLAAVRVFHYPLGC